LRKRAIEALDRAAFQKARECAKELFRREPTEEHRHLLVESTLGRACELRRTGSASDAATIVRSILDAGVSSQEQIARAARELLLVADWSAAGPLIPRVTEPALAARLNATRADAAVLQGPRGLARLPADLRCDTQHVLDALESIARADDQAARAAVAEISDQSPFFDWRLFVEGLAAFYSGAPVHPWQAMAPDRAPAVIAAPFRASQDRAFLDARPDWQQSDLKSVIAQLNTEPWITALEDVQRFIAEAKIGQAVRRAGDVLDALPESLATTVRPRLARVLYWVVAHRGENDHLQTYRRIFGSLPDDPHEHRVRAIHAEEYDDEEVAQELWSAYEQDIVGCGLVADADCDLARSLVWLHMGQIAERCDSPYLSAGRSDLPFERDFDDPGNDPADFDDKLDTDSESDMEDDSDDELEQESWLRFSAPECYRRGIALAPQNREAHECLIDLYERRDDIKGVVSAARQMIATFPEDERALNALAQDASHQNRWDEAVVYLQRAVRARPHDPSLAEQLAFSQLNLARQHAQQGRFDDARTLLTAMLPTEKSDSRYAILCRLAAIEISAGQIQRGDDLFQEACQLAPSRLAAVYRLLIESIRMPLDDRRTTLLEAEFRKLIGTKPDPLTVRELITSVAAFRNSKTTYAGLPNHEPLILGFVKRAKRLKYASTNLLAICKALNAIPGGKLALDFAMHGMKLYPQDPQFPFSAAMFYYALGPTKCPAKSLVRYLSQAKELCQGHAEHADLAEAADHLLHSAQVLHTMQQLNRFTSLAGPRAPLPQQLVPIIERMLGAFDDDRDDDDDDWPDDEPAPQRRR
jgi:tetratricopeptide (TPR) repeat protein